MFAIDKFCPQNKERFSSRVARLVLGLALADNNSIERIDHKFKNAAKTKLIRYNSNSHHTCELLGKTKTNKEKKKL